MSDVVLLEKRNKIAYVTLNRPERRNALNHLMRMALGETWKEIRDDKDVWIGIVQQRGQRRSRCAELAEGPRGVGSGRGVR